MRGFVVSGVRETTPPKTTKNAFPSKIRPISFLDARLLPVFLLPLLLKNTRQRIQRNHLCHVSWIEMRIFLSHSQNGMPKHPLQGQDVTAVHHVMRGEPHRWDQMVELQRTAEDDGLCLGPDAANLAEAFGAGNADVAQVAEWVGRG
jgi:hypothetical protein